MFHFPVSTSTPAIHSLAGNHTSLRLGFPIRTSSDQRLVGNSPRHNAASHVLHRLDMPRHPPCALQNNKQKTITQPPTRTSLTNVWARSVSHNKKQKNKDARVHYTVLTQHTTDTTTKEHKHSLPVLTMLDVRNNPHTPHTVQCLRCHSRHPTACHLLITVLTVFLSPSGVISTRLKIC